MKSHILSVIFSVIAIATAIAQPQQDDYLSWEEMETNVYYNADLDMTCVVDRDAGEIGYVKVFDQSARGFYDAVNVWDRWYGFDLNDNLGFLPSYLDNTSGFSDIHNACYLGSAVVKIIHNGGRSKAIMYWTDESHAIAIFYYL